jgi:hypothetical protein
LESLREFFSNLEGKRERIDQDLFSSNGAPISIASGKKKIPLDSTRRTVATSMVERP